MGAIYRKDTGEILGVWIFGLHAADLIHEASNAIATGQTMQDLKFNATRILLSPRSSTSSSRLPTSRPRQARRPRRLPPAADAIAPQVDPLPIATGQHAVFYISLFLAR